jgi:hypothetical protein
MPSRSMSDCISRSALHYCYFDHYPPALAIVIFPASFRYQLFLAPSALLLSVLYPRILLIPTTLYFYSALPIGL